MLEDDTINLAQHILCKQFKCVNVLKLTNLPPNQFWALQDNISFKFFMCSLDY